MKIAVVVSIGVASLFQIVSCMADDWPQFRGPNRDGRSNETGLLQSWPEQGPKLLWTSEGVGQGYSSVAVVGQRLFTIGDEGGEQVAFGIDRSTGRVAWKTPVGSGNARDFPGSRSTPTVSDGRVYVLSTAAQLTCLQADDGAIIWRRDLKRDFGAELMLAKGKWEWQFSESPTVDEDKVLVTPGSAEAGIVALDKTTGDEIWRAKLPDAGNAGADGAGYSSIVISHAAGRKQYVQMMGRGVFGFDAKTGQCLWSYNRIANDVANIATPIAYDDYVFVSTGYQTGSALLQIQEQGGEFDAKEIYFLSGRQLQNHHGGLILHEGHIYTGHGHNQGLPICVDVQSGEAAWGPQRNQGKSSAAIAYADGHLYLRYQNGLVVLVQATAEGYKEKGSFMIPDVKRESWSHPVISGGLLFLKEQDRIYCYDLRQESNP